MAFLCPLLVFLIAYKYTSVITDTAAHHHHHHHRSEYNHDVETKIQIQQLTPNLPVFYHTNPMSPVSTPTVRLARSPQRQRFLKRPKNTTVVEGDNVKLRCIVQNRVGYLQWLKNGFGLGDLADYPTYKMINSDDDYSLIIKNVTVEDEAMYSCQVTPGPKHFESERLRADAYLTVEVPPKPPVINAGSQMQVYDGQTVNITCVSVGGRPPPSITWINTDGLAFTNDTAIIDTISVANSTMSVSTSTLNFQVKKESHFKNITCEVRTNSTTMIQRKYKVMTAVILLDVHFAPYNTTLEISKNIGPILTRNEEFDNVTMICTSYGNPPVVFSWFVDSKPLKEVLGQLEQEFNTTAVNTINGTRTMTVNIYNISRILHNSKFMCKVKNDQGLDLDSETLELIYGPTFVHFPRQLFSGMKIGSNVSLSCLAEGNPIPNVTWLFSGLNGSTYSFGSHLSLTKIVITVTDFTVGKYECFATIHGDRNVSTKVEITTENRWFASESVNIALGLSIVIVLLIIAILVVCCYRKLCSYSCCCNNSPRSNTNGFATTGTDGVGTLTRAIRTHIDEMCSEVPIYFTGVRQDQEDGSNIESVGTYPYFMERANSNTLPNLNRSRSVPANSHVVRYATLRSRSTRM